MITAKNEVFISIYIIHLQILFTDSNYLENQWQKQQFETMAINKNNSKHCILQWCFRSSSNSLSSITKERSHYGKLC